MTKPKYLTISFKLAEQLLGNLGQLPANRVGKIWTELSETMRNAIDAEERKAKANQELEGLANGLECNI